MAEIRQSSVEEFTRARPVRQLTKYKNPLKLVFF
jgi:hypothetical protein